MSQKSRFFCNNQQYFCEINCTFTRLSISREDVPVTSPDDEEAIEKRTREHTPDGKLKKIINEASE